MSVAPITGATADTAAKASVAPPPLYDLKVDPSMHIQILEMDNPVTGSVIVQLPDKAVARAIQKMETRTATQHRVDQKV